MDPQKLKAEQIRLLESILAHSKRPGVIRTWIIAFLFPEFYEIMGELAKLAGITENHRP
jgi:hypothetical protein